MRNEGTDKMLKTVSAIAAFAALAAAAIIVLPGFSLDVEASAPAIGAKSDRADAADCELRSWPYYDRSCLRDESRNAGRVQQVRLVTTDRIRDAASEELPQADLAATADEVAVEAPSSWQMTQADMRLHLAAGDFIRRTVPQ